MGNRTYNSAHCSIWIEDSPNSGERNMAVDEALLNASAKEGLCALRFYAWEEPTLSLGYFQGAPSKEARQKTTQKKTTPQKITQVEIEKRFQKLPTVRRLSGGGAILHDQELTYSCVIPSSHPIAKNPRDLYRIIHEVFISVLAEFGIPAAFRSEASPGKDAAFLCFLRGSADDLLAGTHKILGSAQRRRSGAVLQHGSLILGTSPLAKEILGLRELSHSPTPSWNDLAAALSKQIAPLLGESSSVKKNEKWGELLHPFLQEIS